MKKKYFESIEPSFNQKQAVAEASRCLLCIDAPCSKMCPAGTDPGSFIRSLRFLNFKGGAATIRKNNALGAICARVCPEEKYCQLGCLRCGIDKPIEIGKLQAFLTDYETQTNFNIYEKAPTTGKNIAIVGSGPASLQAATSLLLLGHSVTIFEKDAKLGGYLRYGIPEYRLSTCVLDAEIQRIIDLGLTYKLKQTVDTKKLKTLKNEYDAVVVATGLSKGKTLDMFKDSQYRIAVDLLKEIKEKSGKIKLPDHVLVIGGGDVAMDVNSSLKLLGVKNITNVVYETLDEFRASVKELETARHLQTTIIDGYAIDKVSGQEVTFKHRHLNNKMIVEAPLIVLAIGQTNELARLGLNEKEELGIHISDNVFAAGDIAKGDKTVVYAVKTGKAVADQVHQYLGGNN